MPLSLSRRTLLLSLAGASAGLQAQALPPTLVFLGFELQDEQPDPAREAEHQARLAVVARQFSEGLHNLGLYRLKDAAGARSALAAAREQSEFLYRCNGCLGAVGQAVDAQLVGVGWVQRVSNLILNLNVEIRDARDDRMVLTKSVDIRGDNGESWRRGVAYMLRDMAERRQRQPAYGF
jgi:hypothetical protein